jgi:biopolymer transport protein TolR
MGMRAGGSDELNSEINVTPLVDVMLVLLIIFMVAAPMMNTGVDVELPQVTAVKIDDPKGKLILSIDKEAHLRLGSGKDATAIEWKKLKEILATNERLKTEKVLWVEGYKDLPYSVIVTAMAAAKEAGIEKVQLLTDPAAKLNVEELDKGLPTAGPGPGTPK